MLLAFHFLSMTYSHILAARGFFVFSLLSASVLCAPVALAAPELPDFDEATFSNPTTIDHPYFSLQVGKEMRFESETEDGLEVIEIDITGETKEILGVTTLVYWDRVYLDDELVEDTRDYLAQDDDGNVWYFGEDVDNYEDGELDNHNGSWLTGEDGAKPGYWMPGLAKLVKGYEYKEEWYEGKAEDEAKIVSTNAVVKIDLGTYTNCLKTENTTPLEPDILEYKYYCKAVSGLALEKEEDENVALVSVILPDDEEEADDEKPGQGDEHANIRALQTKLIGILQQLITLMKQLKAQS